MKKNKKAQQEQAKKFLTMYADHPRPVTRRDFLSTGLIGFGGWLMAPSALTLMLRSHEAYAAECPKPKAGAAKVAFLHIVCSGGIAYERWFQMGRNPNGDGMPSNPTQLGSYDRNGWSTNEGLNSATGYPMPNGSAFLAQMNANLGAARVSQIMPKVSVATFGLSSPADNSAGNPFSNLGLINQMTNASFVGSQNSASGVGQAFNRPSTARAIQVTRPDTIEALSKGGGDTPTPQTLARVFETAKKLNTSEIARLSGLNFGEQLAFLLGCSADSAKATVTSSGLNYKDPTNQNTVALALKGMPAPNFTGGNPGEYDMVNALVYATVAGDYSAASYEIGGCDIHDGTPGRDSEVRGARKAGAAVASFFAACQAAGIKGMVYMTSEGSALADGAGAPWTGDFNGTTAVMMAYDGTAQGARPFGGKMFGGWMSDTQIQGSPLTPANVGDIVALNYYKFLNGNLLKDGKSVKDQMMPGFPFDPAKVVIL